MSMQSLDVISINLWQMLISLCNLVILYAILKKFLYKPVRKALEALPGVAAAQASHEKGTAVVTLTAPVDDSVLKKAVEDKDYKVTGIH